MGETRAETVVLAILELIGVITACMGLWYQYVSKLTLEGVIYCSIWYVLGFLSNLLGLISITVAALEEDEMKGDSQSVLQYHYMAGWLNVIVGYPLMVTYTWMILYPTFYLAQVHIVLCVVPLLMWVCQSSTGIVRTTQICTIIATASHFTLCFVAADFWGWTSAIVMFLNVIALSTPTKYHIWAFNSREVFMIGLVATSILMNNSIQNLARPERIVYDIFSGR